MSVVIVLEPMSLEALRTLRKRGPVWVSPVGENAAFVEKLWAESENEPYEITFWSSLRTGESVEEWKSMLDDVEVHHSEGWCGPGIARVEVYGKQAAAYASQALAEAGYQPLEPTEWGFLAEIAA